MYFLERNGHSALGNFRSSVKVKTLDEVAKYLSISINTFFLFQEICRPEGAKSTELKFFKNKYVFKFIGWDDEDELEEEFECKKDLKSMESLINEISCKYGIGAIFKFKKLTMKGNYYEYSRN